MPGLLVAIGGQPIAGAMSLEIESTGYFSADRFTLLIAVGADPAFGMDDYAGLTAQTITFDISASAGSYVSLLTGQVDNVRLDLLSNTASLSGRDLSARLIDAELSETFVNQTSSQIAAVIAARHGLSANVTPTATPVGQYYELDHARSGLGLNSRSTTEWNLLCHLAQIESFDLSVTGATLNFGPASPDGPVAMMPQNFSELTFDIATTIPEMVAIKSWNTRNKQVVSAGAGPVSGVGTSLIKPNLTTAQASTLAANHLASLQRHVIVMAGHMPGETALAPNRQIVMAGTNSRLDQAYVIDAVRRRVDPQSGFTQAVRAYAVSAAD